MSSSSFVIILLAVFAAVELACGARRLKREDVPQDLRCLSDKWAHFRSKCYLIEDDRSSLTEATASCLRMDASLVDVETKAEHDFLTKLLDQEVNYYNWQNQFWTGGYRDGIRWKWSYQKSSKTNDEVSTSEMNEYIPITIDYWLPNEPSTAAHTGMLLSYKENVWGWEDAATASRHLYICEKEKGHEGCSRPWTEYINSCYYTAKNVRKAQTEAKELCSDRGGHLVAINSLEENRHLIKIIKKLGALDTWKSFWIGGERINGDGGTFAWDISKRPATIPFSRMLNSTTRPWDKNLNYMTLEKVGSEWYMSEKNLRTRLPFICELALQLTDVNQNKILTCPGDYSALGHGCYLVYKDRKERYQAGRTCNKDGGLLFSVDNEKELLLLSMLLDDTTGIGNKLWVGGIKVNGQWIWTRDYRKFLGTPNQFVPWSAGEPNNWDGEEDRIAYSKREGAWEWNDIPIRRPNNIKFSFGFICEKGAKPYEKKEINIECKTDKIGSDYVGKISKTRSGLPCQRWDTMQPNAHPYRNVAFFPDVASSISEVSNYCRNPDKSFDGPWCYIGVVGGGRREKCNVPICEGAITTTSTPDETIEEKESECPERYVSFQGQCYFVTSTRRRRSSAIRSCQAMDAKLVKIESKPVFSFVTKYIDSKYNYYGRRQFWTGGLRDGLKWIWNDEKRSVGSNSPEKSMETSLPLTFSDWRPGEPNHLDEKAVSIKYSSGYWGWNDIYTKNTIKLRFICEKPKSNSDDCPEQWEMFEDSCYYFSSSNNNGAHSEAKQACRDRFSHLVAINSAAENSFLKRQLNERKREYSHYEEWWTGGERIGGVGGQEFIWDTTIPEAKPFRKWKPGKPNRYGLDDDYIVLEYNPVKEDWYWSHTPRTESLSYICKLPLVSEYLNGTSRAVCPATCNEAYQFKDSCYCTSSYRRQWLAAQIKCMRSGGRLVSIRNEAEMEAIVDNILKPSRSKRQWWTGGIPIDGKWVWSEDYAKFTVIPDQYAKWSLGEPNNFDGFEKYILLNQDRNGWGWNDDRNYRFAGYICQKTAESPTPLILNGTVTESTATVTESTATVTETTATVTESTATVPESTATVPESTVKPTISLEFIIKLLGQLMT